VLDQPVSHDDRVLIAPITKPKTWSKQMQISRTTLEGGIQSRKIIPHPKWIFKIDISF
jgi:hypothetical protein